MEFDGIAVSGLLAALGGGLLVGIERERRRGERPDELAAGVRTFILVSLAGVLGAILGTATLVVVGVAVVVFALACYSRPRPVDQGLTTKFALLLTYLLGAAALSHAQLAAGLFVLMTVVLASKESLHRFTRQVLTREELADVLLLAASALIVLPLLPDRTIDPFAVLNPRKLWLFAVLVMAINAAGYVALRALGPRRGLAIAGLFGGFVSSTATIAGMGQRAKDEPALRPSCIAAALLSNIATLIQLVLILLAVSPALLRYLAVPLAAAAIAAIAIAAVAVLRAHGAAQPQSNESSYGSPFTLMHALLFVAIVAAALFGAALLRNLIGTGGVFAAALVSGLADVHAAAVALGELAATQSVSVTAAAQALVLAYTANSTVKCIGASLGGSVFGRALTAGILAVNAVFALALILVSV